MIFERPSLAVFCFVLTVCATADAWEPETTHPGFTEKAAIDSSLHGALVDKFGLSDGLFSTLEISPEITPALYKALRQFSPSHGYSPSAKGRMSALGWLMAGSAIADLPGQNAANHFFAPTTKKGLSTQTLRGLGTNAELKWLETISADSLNRKGLSAIDWVQSKDNPFGLLTFREQYVSAVRAELPKDRQRHLASALLAAGSILHVLQDLGSPSHVRNDLAAHLQPLGGGRNDRGSRHERIAALAYGRLGISGIKSSNIAKIKRDTVRDFFSTEAGNGLADITASAWFSIGTVPSPIDIQSNESTLNERLRLGAKRKAPGPSAWFDEEANMVTDDEGRCLANAIAVDGKFEFYIDDNCYLEQLRWQIPVIIGFNTGLLEMLFNPGLNLKMDGALLAVRGTGAEFGDGLVTIFWDDKEGKRTPVFRAPTSRENTRLLYRDLKSIPQEAVRVSALFEGTNHRGDSLVATGTLDLTEKISPVDLGETPPPELPPEASP